jgi:Spy/CpxP family protein refolding chaperone
MNRRIGRAVLCAGLAALMAGLVTSIEARAQAPAQPSSQPRRFAWWRADQFQKNLGLSADQVSRLEMVFQGALPDLRRGNDDLTRQEDELSRLIEMNADEAVVIKQIDKVEAIRTHLNKTRQLLLLHQRQLLTPEQRVKLKALFDQMQADRAQAERDRAAKPSTGQKP